MGDLQHRALNISEQLVFRNKQIKVPQGRIPSSMQPSGNEETRRLYNERRVAEAEEAVLIFDSILVYIQNFFPAR